MVTKSYIIGLPASGKTTFLGALGYSLLNNTIEENVFEIDLIDNLDYIKSLANTWSQCEEMDRTKRNSYVITKLQLQDKDNNKLELYIPDQSGEEFEYIVKNRSMNNTMYKEIEACDNIFLFVNPSKISNDLFIKDLAPEYRNVSQEKVDALDKTIMHEQTQYVSILQDVYVLRKRKTEIKIVISAWDEYQTEMSPSELLKIRLPLLWQYLTANREAFECEYWGISAQGGDLTNPEEKEKLQSISDAIERIIVVNDNKQVTHDLSILLK
jgi:GTPase SAR1 family protein